MLYECICSDHHPLLFCIDFDFVPAYGTGSTSENKRAIHWDSLRPCDINNYTDYTELELNKIKVPQGIKCNDPNCRNHSHREEIDELYDSIVIALKKCSDALVSTGKRRAKDVIVPGWNEQVKELHVEARHAYLTWRDVGKPRQGDIFTTMKLSRSKFKYALRKCKRDKETVIADIIAEKLCQKDSRDFWKNIKQMTNKNHMLYADDIVLFAPSAKGLQKLLDISQTYGCNYDIEYNPSKSSIMYIDSRKAGNARSMTIGGKILNVVTAFSYLGHIICDDLSDEADLKAKSRQMYAKSNTLRNKFHMCSTAVKVKLFTAYFNNVYMCALWVNYRKTAFQQFKVAYNNSYRILNRLPMRCSASNMFANGNVNSCACVLRKSIYSLMTRIHASLNPIVNSIVRGDVYCTSALRIQWVSQLYNM